MEVILIKEVVNTGNPGDIVNVKDGFARNYLLPQKLAVLKTKQSLAVLEKQKEEFAKAVEEKKETYQTVIEKLKELEQLTLTVRTGEDGKLFGTVTNAHIAEAIEKECGIAIDKRQVLLKEHIKMIGTYTAFISLNKDFKTEIQLEVKSDIV